MNSLFPRDVWSLNLKLFLVLLVLIAVLVTATCAMLGATVASSVVTYYQYLTIAGMSDGPTPLEAQFDASITKVFGPPEDPSSAQPNTWSSLQELENFFARYPSEPGQGWHQTDWLSGTCVGINRPNQVTLLPYHIYSLELLEERSGYYPCGMVRAGDSCLTYCKVPNGLRMPLLPEQLAP